MVWFRVNSYLKIINMRIKYFLNHTLSFDLGVVVAFVTGSIGDRLKIKNLNGLKIKLWKVGA